MLDDLALETQDYLTPLQIKFTKLANDHNVTIYPKISNFFVECYHHLLN